MCERSKQQQGLKAPLGIKTKSSSPSECEKTAFRKIRKERYQLSRAARAIYAKQGEEEGYEYVLNYHRTAKCCYIAHSDVLVHVSSEYQKAFLSGVTACGSVHTCPVCGAKIEERRRSEIEKGVAFWYAMKNKTVSMITFTFSHSLSERLEGVLSKQRDALERLRSGKAWTKFKAVFGFDSLIRSLEVTWGEENGWHPHTHELWCIDKEIDRDRLAVYLKARFRAKRHADRLERLLAADPRAVFEELLLERWEACCEAAGLMVKPDGTAVSLDAFRKRALDVKHDVSVGDYLAKQDDSRHWGVDREMAKASTKNGKKKGMHPFGFLAKFAETGDGVWAGRWLEYSRAIDGKSRLFWSHGLKKRVGLDEKTDEEIAAEQEDHSIVVYQMVDDEWKKARHNVPRVLSAAEDDENLREVIEQIEELDDFAVGDSEQMRDDRRQVSLKNSPLDDSPTLLSDAELAEFKRTLEGS